MEINFGNYRLIRYDKLNICVQEFKRHVAKHDTPLCKKGHVSEKWVTLGYYGNNVTYALEHLLREKFVKSDSDSINGLIDEINGFKDDVDKKLEEFSKL